MISFGNFAILICTSLLFQVSGALSQSDGKQSLAVLPFETRGLSSEEGSRLRERFVNALIATARFRLVSDAAMANSLPGAAEHRDTIISIATLSPLGKKLNVESVVLVHVYRWNGRFAMIVSLVRSEDAQLLYSERIDYSGEFSDLLETIIPEQGRRLASARLDSGTRWDLVAVLGIAGVGLILFINRRLGRPNSPRPLQRTSDPIR